MSDSNLFWDSLDSQFVYLGPVLLVKSIVNCLKTELSLSSTETSPLLVFIGSNLAVIARTVLQVSRYLKTFSSSQIPSEAFVSGVGRISRTLMCLCECVCTLSRSLIARFSSTVEAPVGIFGVPLQTSIRYANVAISLTNDKGENYVYGYVPIVVAKCGVFLKEKGT